MLQSGVMLTSLQVAHAEEPLVVPARAQLYIPTPKYSESIYQTRRRPTRTIQVMLKISSLTNMLHCFDICYVGISFFGRPSLNEREGGLQHVSVPLSQIGNVKVGSDHPIALQTMTTTDTRDIEATVDQVKRCADAGADMVRITVQGRKEAEACGKIRDRLFQDGYDVPLVADIHFQPAVAMLVADAFEKIRINPGNFADGAKKFETINYDDPTQFEAEKDYIREVFAPLVDKCKRLNRAMRIGTNHGSLSARILSFYGDTPRGMVESAFEFADICRDMDYHNFLFSMKASNPLVMVQAYRLLAEEMYAKGWDYPMHLGVTEAGEGEDGRMKSAIGIGALLMDGLGDTIRVSLTEDPEYEIDPCGRLAALGTTAAEQAWGVEPFEEHRDTHLFTRRTGVLPERREGETLDMSQLLHRDGSVLSVVDLAELEQPELLYRKLGAKLAVGMPFKDIATSDSIIMYSVPPASDVAGRRALRRLQEVGVHVLAPAEVLKSEPTPDAVAIMQLAVAASAQREGGVQLPAGAARLAVFVDGTESDADLAALKELDAAMVLLRTAPGLSRVHASRRVFEVLQRENIDVPVVHHVTFPDGAVRDEIIINAGSQVGALMVDGRGDGLVIECGSEDLDFLRTTSFGLLQGCRMRNIKTEYVSCPSCGRTLFDLQDVTEQIRQRTGHLPGVSIAVMGCIVNGPGEMADADFGYVGGAPGKIDLYVGKEVVRKGIQMDTAPDALIDLIKEHGRWQDPPVEEGEQGAQVAAAASSA
jgi:(E)-4-hydroxy-3-methylbut-2-enyl-diphosphate synthase